MSKRTREIEAVAREFNTLFSKRNVHGLTEDEEARFQALDEHRTQSRIEFRRKIMSGEWRPYSKPVKRTRRM